MNAMRKLAAWAMIWCAVTAATAGQARLTRIDGAVVSGELIGLWPDVALRSADGETLAPWSDVLRLECAEEQKDAGAPEPPLRVTLTDGVVLLASVERVESGNLLLKSRDGRIHAVGVSMTAAIEPTTPAARAKTNQIMSDDALQDDVVVVAKDDKQVVLHGVVEEILATGVRFQWSGKSLHVPWDRLALLRRAVAVDAAAPVLVTTRGGDVYCGRLVGGDGASLALRCTSLGSVELAAKDVLRIEFRSDRVRYLGELRPVGYEMTPIVTRPWEYSVDQSLTGHGMQMRGRTYDRGVCMHSRSRLTYRIDGRFQRFVADVGVLDEMTPRGDAVARIIADGKTIWEASSLRGGAPPLLASVPIEGVRELTLEVDYGADLDLADHVCWGAARLIQK